MDKNHYASPNPRENLLIPSSSEKLTKDMAGSPPEGPNFFDLVGERMVRIADANENSF